jgi:hypothetical protein
MTRTFYILTTLCVVFFASFSAFGLASEAGGKTLNESAPLSVEFDHLDEGILYFKSTGDSTPSPLKTGLTDAKLVGILRPLPGGEPFALITGKTCKNCQADEGLFALPPSGGKPSGYLFPGKIFESKNHALAYEGRAFFGRCLSRKTHDVLVIFQRETVDRKHGLLKSVLISEPALEHEGGLQSHLHETLLEAHLPSLNDTLRLVKHHECAEIAGRNRVMLSHPLDVQLHGSRPLRDEDDVDKTDDEAQPEENP